MMEIRTIATPGRMPVASTRPSSASKPMTEVKNCVPGGTVITLDTGNKVFICSPFRPVGDTVEAQAKSIKAHKILARYACRFAVAKGYSPLCPHLYYPEFLDDDVEDEREIGMLLGMVGLSECKELWVIGRRISEGMKKEIDQARRWGIPVKRYIPRFTPEEHLLKAIFGDDFPYTEMV